MKRPNAGAMADLIRYADVVVSFGRDPDDPTYDRLGYATARPFCQLEAAARLRAIADQIEADHATGCDTTKAGKPRG